MKRKCCVPICNSADKCPTCQIGLSYFKVPKESSLARKWEIALGLKEQSLIPRYRVCSSHFREADIITKRFVSLKRPSTNSKMILEITKLERGVVPTTFHRETRPCNHATRMANKRASTSSMMKSSRSEGSSSPPASSQSDDDGDEISDERSTDNGHTKKQHSQPTRKDYRLLARSVEQQSRRRQIRAFANLEKKWLAKSRTLEKQISLLRAKIRELETEEYESYQSQ